MAFQKIEIERSNAWEKSITTSLKERRHLWGSGGKFRKTLLYDNMVPGKCIEWSG